MLFWTQEEYKKFSEEMMDKPVSFYAFEMLYWCGIREGELLALTPADFDFDRETVTISKSYQRIGGRDIMDAQIENATILDHTVTFHFRDGHTESRDFLDKRHGTPWTEERREKARESMKAAWTDERREAMSERIKKIRSEKKWPNP